MESAKYWNLRYGSGNSGYGSYGEQLAKKLGWLKLLEVHSIFEVGCGDFNFGKNLVELYGASYEGVDISEVIINRNKQFYPQHTFSLVDDQPFPSADLLVCVDVLFHVLENQELTALLIKLKTAWTKYLILTAYEYDDNETSPHVKIRKFDPGYFGKPIVREVVEEDGQLYFYIFQR